MDPRTQEASGGEKFTLRAGLIIPEGLAKGAYEERRFMPPFGLMISGVLLGTPEARRDCGAERLARKNGESREKDGQAPQRIGIRDASGINSGIIPDTGPPAILISFACTG